METSEYTAKTGNDPAKRTEGTGKGRVAIKTGPRTKPHSQVQSIT